MIRRATAGISAVAVALVAVRLATAQPLDEQPLPSGTTFLSATLKAQQADPAVNPGMLWVDEGARLWQQPAGAARKACADCHGTATQSMKGVATRYPAIDTASRELVNIEGRINLCRTRHQNAEEPLAYESEALLGLTAYVARQSHGLPMGVITTGDAAAPFAAGKAFFYRRQGQLNLSCAQCHVDHAGQRLRGDVISHAVTTGYPTYRIDWQSLGSLHRRLRACSAGVRAITFPAGSREYLALELYLAKRAEGVAVETPAIRR